MRMKMQRAETGLGGGALGSGPVNWLAELRENIRATGREPGKMLLGFFLAWGLFFFILKVMPAPEGLPPAGQATLAVMIWACTMWIFEAIPVGISGVLIPMLLVMTGAVTPFPSIRYCPVPKHVMSAG